jgi:hypothetical protein
MTRELFHQTEVREEPPRLPPQLMHLPSWYWPASVSALFGLSFLAASSGVITAWNLPAMFLLIAIRTSWITTVCAKPDYDQVHWLATWISSVVLMGAFSVAASISYCMACVATGGTLYTAETDPVVVSTGAIASYATILLLWYWSIRLAIRGRTLA